MSSGMKLTGLLLAGALCLPVAGWAETLTADTQAAPATTHRVHRVKKVQAQPPLPSGPQGPVPQIPLDAMPPVAPQVSYQDGMLTIVAPNSTLGDILRGVKKHTSADIEIPPTASERVVTHLGPGPAREVMAELLNGSRFNYVLLGSAEDANLLTRVVLVPKTADPANPQEDADDKAAAAKSEAASAAAGDNDPPDDAADDNPDPATAEAEPEQPAAKTPQQMLQEMQQRQMQMQQQGGPTPFPGRPGAFIPPQQQQPQQQE
ncbi:MAG: hypothetical protein ACLQLC_19955 [Candidatus Sulfotelmatobacter sp.]